MALEPAPILLRLRIAASLRCSLRRVPHVHSSAVLLDSLHYISLSELGQALHFCSFFVNPVVCF